MKKVVAENLDIPEFITVSGLASILNVDPAQVIMTCMDLGVIVSINQRLDAETIKLVLRHKDSMESKQKLGYYNPVLAFVKENDSLDFEFLDLINGLNIIFKQIPGYGPLTADDIEWVLNQPDNKIAQTNISCFRGVVLAKSKDKNLQVKNHRYKSALVYFDTGDEIPDHISYAGEKEFNSVSVFQQAIALKQVK